ncbi:hypothetical protein GCM10010399_56930 [Dactylosporangium fulvum]|uniref:Uncharacterized protein n=1 Tax=Dactylosporangium fulvum TaxID=53359 RepID=A0ABY5VUS0_9ACTN|nr:hypothetical protein [Dactylosporangium fulvum]UWP80841.1 hypothetical protein Dfulv_37765 [Dactylosporangium fulvum]
MTAAPALTPADDLAQRLLPIVMADPVRAKVLADAALRDARRDGDAASEVVALRALGLVAHTRHDAAQAADLLRASIRVARKYRLARAPLSQRYLPDRVRPAPASAPPPRPRLPRDRVAACRVVGAEPACMLAARGFVWPPGRPLPG